MTIRQSKGQKDPVMQLLRELRTETGRTKHGLFIVEEAEMVRRAIDMGAETETVILSDSFAVTAEAGHLLDKLAQKNIRACSASAGLLDKMLGSKPTPDCLAIVKKRIAGLHDILSTECALIQTVENCESADNLGMLLRSTDAAGVDGVVLSADTTDPFSRRAVRGSRGAVFSTPICIAPGLPEAFESARKNGIMIVGTSATATANYTDIDYSGPTMIVVGNEHVGLSAGTRTFCDSVVRIPMRGRIHSLNISAAVSIMLFEAVRQREAQEGRNRRDTLHPLSLKRKLRLGNAPPCHK